MSRKVTIEVKVKLIVNIEEGISIDHIISDMDYDFSFDGEEAEIQDTEIIDYNIMDSK